MTYRTRLVTSRPGTLLVFVACGSFALLSLPAAAAKHPDTRTVSQDNDNDKSLDTDPVEAQGRGQGKGQGRGKGKGKGKGRGRGQGQGQGQGQQGGQGRGKGPGGGRGRGPDEAFAQDRDTFHFLLSNHKNITRKVTMLKQGVETITESDDPEIAAKIQEHVEGMYARVKDVKPIRMHDPLFVEIFRHAKKIEMKHELTEKGVKVVETSEDPYVAKLIKEHAKVVSAFVSKGFDEAHKNHKVPKK